MKKILLLGLAIIAAVLLVPGCKSPSPFLFDPYTNVVSQTVEPLRTNFTTIYVTNAATQVIVTNTVEKIVWLTNTVLEVGYNPSTNAAGIAGGAGAVSGVIVPGTSGVVEAGLLGLLTLAAGFWRHRVVVRQLSDQSEAEIDEQKTLAANAAKALTYTVENYRDVILKLPNGAAIDTALMNEAQKAQTALSVSALVADIVKTYIRDPDIQKASAAIAEEARRLAGTPPQ